MTSEYENDRRKVTGLEGRIFTGIFLPEIDVSIPYTEESDAARAALSTHVFNLYLSALRYAFGDETVLHFEEIDAVPLFDTMMVQYDGGAWDWCEDPNVAGITYGIEAALMATRQYWLSVEALPPAPPIAVSKASNDTPE